MNRRFLSATAVAFLLSGLVMAQGCPQERTRTVPGSIAYGPNQTCNGIDAKVGAVQVTSAGAACPTFVIYTPPHEVVEPSNTDTRVKLLQFDAVTMISFRCDFTYLLFIPLDSTCVIDQTLRVGSVPRLITVGCGGNER